MKRGLVVIIFLMFLFGAGFVSALEIMINNAEPEESYNTKSLTIGLSDDEKSDFFYLRESWIPFCRNAFECTKKMTFMEGPNAFTYKAVNNNGIVENGEVS